MEGAEGRAMHAVDRGRGDEVYWVSDTGSLRASM